MRHPRQAVPKGTFPPGAASRFHESPRPSGSAKAQVEDSAWLDAAHRLHISPRELQILRRLFDGLGEKEIANQLSVSERTVHTHTTRLYLRLQVHNRAHLLARVFCELRSASERYGCDVAAAPSPRDGRDECMPRVHAAGDITEVPQMPQIARPARRRRR